MLTPPSAHCQAFLKHPPVSRHDCNNASERREAELAAQLQKERARALAARREHIALAQQERDSYLANVRTLFKMSPKVQPVGGYQRARALSQPVGTPKRSAWSEVSTAAPSSACAEDYVDDCTEPSLNSPAPVHRYTRDDQVEPPCVDLSDSLEGPLEVASRRKGCSDPNANEEPGKALVAKSHQEHKSGKGVTAAPPRPPPLQQRSQAVVVPAGRIASGGVSTSEGCHASSSSSSSARNTDGRRAMSASPTPSANVARRDELHVQQRCAGQNNVEEHKERKCAPPPPQLKTISAEEEALERSLLLLDFGEMRRQFAGKDPLWKKEAFDASFEAHSVLGATRHEEKIKASLERLDNVIGNIRADLSAREEEEAARAKRALQEAEVLHAPCPSRERAPPSRGGRPCSSATTSCSRRTRASSAGSYGRRVWTEKVAQPVTTISALPSGRASTGSTADNSTECATAAEQRRTAHQHPPMRRKR